jgi:O-antigen/teichoic acid export membrane protein
MFYIFAGVLSLWLATALPVVCKMINEDLKKTKTFLDKFMRLTMLLTIPTTVLVCLAAPLLIKLFFGNGYAESITALRYLIWALIPLAVSNTFGGLILVPAGLFNWFLFSVAAGAGVNIILNIVLIPKYSYLGAAVATIFAQAVAGLIAFYYARRFLPLGFITYLVKPIIISLLASLAFFLSSYLFPGQPDLWQLIVSSLVFAASAGLLVVYLEYEFMAGFIKEIIGGRPK